MLQLNDAFHKKEKDKWDLDKLHLFRLILVLVLPTITLQAKEYELLNDWMFEMCQQISFYF